MKLVSVIGSWERSWGPSRYNTGKLGWREMGLELRKAGEVSFHCVALVRFGCFPVPLATQKREANLCVLALCEVI